MLKYKIPQIVTLTPYFFSFVNIHFCVKVAKVNDISKQKI